MTIVGTQSAPVAGSNSLTLVHDRSYPQFGPNVAAPPWLTANDADADGDTLVAQNL